MRVVDRPWKTPGRCAVIAHVDPVSVPSAVWLDSGNILQGWDQHVYLSDVAVRQAMSVLGYPLPIEFEQLLARALEAEEREGRLGEMLAEAEAQLQAVDLLESKDYTARRKQARKPVVA